MKNPFEIYGSSGRGQKPSHLDWEESAHDDTSPVEGFADDNTEARILPKLGWLKFLVLGACAILVIKLFSLQIVQGGKYKILAEGNRLRVVTILAPRGEIQDRSGIVLARNTASYSLVAVPADLPKTNFDSEVTQISVLLNLDETDIRDKLKNFNPASFQPILLKQDLSQEESILLQTHAAEFPGFSINSIPIRDYQNAQAFSHVLGYAGIVSSDELNQLGPQGYEANDFIGKSGIEQQYEQYLRGTNGAEQVEVDSTGHPTKVLGNIDPHAGDVVQLNINSQLQQDLYNAFMKTAPHGKGAAVALDPRTGAVLALVSVPGYDNNLFAHGISQADYQKLISNPLLPLFNRAISGTYPPGSTSKLMTATAGLQEGTITDKTVIVDTGKIIIPNQFLPGQQYVFNGWKPGGLGPMTVRSAIAQSSDIFFYTVGGGQPGSPITGLGVEKLAEYYRKFALGKLSGIDLQGEKPGLVPDPAWKAARFPDSPIDAKWYLGDTYHIAIGQGDLLVTPLQVALWTMAIANNGIIYKPTILKQVTDQSGKVILSTSREVLANRIASPDVIKIVQQGMRETVLSGTGRSLNTLPITSAGKTGTSQFDAANPLLTDAWWTMYAPYEQPKVVITVLVESGGEGFSAAAPIAKQALIDCMAQKCLDK